MPAALTNLDPATLQAWLAQDSAILVDVREADEYAREHIEGALLRPLSTMNGGALPQAPAKTLVLMCNSGNRTRQLAATLEEPKEVHHLAGGIQAWKQAGLPVAANTKAPLPLMRQVQITAGGMVVLGIVLALLVSPWFMALSAFVGAGLVFAGLTGTCGLARMLQLLPYNRVG
jgi:rhodanese-related sulfurtransferase